MICLLSLSKVLHVLYVNINVFVLYLHVYMCGVFTRYCLSMCVCVCVCVCGIDCVGSQRVTEPEFDEGTAVVSKGGWGLFLSITSSVSWNFFFYLRCYSGVLLATCKVCFHFPFLHRCIPKVLC